MPLYLAFPTSKKEAQCLPSISRLLEATSSASGNVTPSHLLGTLYGPVLKGSSKRKPSYPTGEKFWQYTCYILCSKWEMTRCEIVYQLMTIANGLPTWSETWKKNDWKTCQGNLGEKCMGRPLWEKKEDTYVHVNIYKRVTAEDSSNHMDKMTRSKIIVRFFLQPPL